MGHDMIGPSGIKWDTIFATACWYIWKWRSERTFISVSQIWCSATFIITQATNFQNAWLKDYSQEDMSHLR